MAGESARIYEAHRLQLEKLIKQHGVAPLRKIYAQAEKDLEERLAAIARRDAGSFGAHQLRSMMVQVRQGQARLVRRATAVVGAADKPVLDASLRGLMRSVNRLEQRYRGGAIVLPIEEASRFASVVARRRTSLLDTHSSSMNRYGARVVRGIEKDLRLGLATARSNDAMVKKVMDRFGGQQWQAERIVRTELSWASNAVQVDALQEVDEDDDPLYARWTEHVSDGGMPLDDRVGVDSLAMHGQVARPGDMFTMPPTAPGGKAVSPGLVGRQWEHPPNRPNDRAAIQAWRSGWGTSAWRWAGRRVPMR